MDELKTIINAWITSINPNEEEKNLATLRREICDSCPSNKETLKGNRWSAKCTMCGCPISKKVYTKEFNACPSGKWEDVDLKFFDKTFKKHKTLL